MHCVEPAPGGARERWSGPPHRRKPTPQPEVVLVPVLSPGATAIGDGHQLVCRPLRDRVDGPAGELAPRQACHLTQLIRHIPQSGCADGLDPSGWRVGPSRRKPTPARARQGGELPVAAATDPRLPVVRLTCMDTSAVPPGIGAGGRGRGSPGGPSTITTTHPYTALLGRRSPRQTIDTVSIDTVSISPAARPGQLFRSLSWHGSWHEIWSYGRRPLYTVNRSTCTDGPD